jgi:glycosyltransferase involved in cell wall biosynthesis
VVQLTTDAREHRRDYACANPYFGTAPEALLQGFAALREVEIHVVSCTRQPMQSPDRLAENIWFHSLHVPKLGWMRTLYAGCIRATRHKLAQIQPDIVHGQGTELDCSISAVHSGFPSVVTLHGIMQEQAKLLRARPGSFYWLAKHLEKHTLRRTAGVFCNSRYTEETVRRQCRKTWRVPNALNRAYFDQPIEANRPDRPILLNIGLVCLRKRQMELLDLASAMRREGLDFELRFLGTANPSDAYAAEFLNRIRSSDSSISHQGFKTTVDLIKQFDAASALVHVPSEESFGLVVAEALARNLKLFGFKVGGIRDIAEGVDAVELWPDGDWAGLRSGISRWCRAGWSRASGSAESMRQRYHPEIIALRHLEIYREVLSNRS